MLRRSYKKSREGCAQCKKRHVKCDEGRPVCRLCVNSQRECSFSQTTPSTSRSLSPTSTNKQADHPLPAAPSLSTSSPQSPHILKLISRNTCTDNDTTNEPINYAHMELLIHMLTSPEIYNLGAGSTTEHKSGLLLGLKTSLHHPFLLPKILAFSARHLAHAHPAHAAFRLHQSTVLQTQALTLFNASWTAVTPHNCVAVLLFSSILAHHLLADMLGMRDAPGLDAWLDYYAACVESHRGIYAIAVAAWPLLMASDVAPILAKSKRFTSREPRGEHCVRARQLVETSPRLSDVEREACVCAVRYLQVGFDAVVEGGEGRFHMIFTWAMLASVEFMGLLKERRPEALVLLAYYAWLLHCGREEWQVGDAGVYVMGLVGDYLGKEWEEWLERPRCEIEGVR